MAIQLKRCTTEERLASTVVLANGQPLYDTDLRVLYIGDGVTAVKDLIGTQIGLNIENSIGSHSLQQTTAVDTDDAYLRYDATKTVAENTSTDTEIKYLPKSNSLEDRNKITDRDNVALGENSAALGDGNFAGPKSKRSFIAGKLNEVYPSNGITAGLRNVVGRVNGSSHNSIVAGESNTVESRSSVVVGLRNTKTDTHGQGILFGEGNTDNTINSIVGGQYNNLTRSVDSSIIVGSRNTIVENEKDDPNNPTVLSGIFMSGSGNKLYGRACSIIGTSNEIILNSNSYGNSFVGGVKNKTTFGNNLLFGYGLVGSSAENTIFGTYNTQWIAESTVTEHPEWATSNYIGKAMFQIGCGTGENKWGSNNQITEVNRRNAFEVWKPEYSATNTNENDKFGKVKVYRTPTEDNDVLRYQEKVALQTDITNTYDIALQIGSRLDDKADKATTLSGYGINNAYTKTEVDNKDSSTLTSARSYTDTTINGLNGTYKNSDTARTVDTISQTNGKINVTYKDIEITKQHITDLTVYGEIEGSSDTAKEVITLYNPKPYVVYILIATRYTNRIASSEVEKTSYKMFTLSDVASLTSLDGSSIQYIKGENKLEIIGSPGAGISTDGQWVANTQLKLITL